MPISDKDVLHVAKLARLKLTPAEVELYRGQLGRILEHIAELDKLDVRAVEPTAHVLGLTDALREDEPRLSEDREQVLGSAPAREGPYFKVPKVIE
jgi:aspartyl-tRNA(Asn)/glutamyl-tRNA(Gln) amidotransferase subunit C